MNVCFENSEIKNKTFKDKKINCGGKLVPGTAAVKLWISVYKIELN